jgi:hypothetical protein
MEEMSIEKRVLLLGIYKRKEDESLNEVLMQLANNGLFELKDGKKLLKELKNEEYVLDGGLSFIGIQKAKEVEAEFKI